MRFPRLFSIFTRSRLRHPTGVFSLIFAPVLLLAMGLLFERNLPVPAYASLTLAMYGALLIPYNLLSLRESGVLQRLRFTPLRPATILAATLTVDCAVCCVGSVATLGCGRALFDAAPTGNIFAVLGGVLLAVTAFGSLGLLLSNVYRSCNIANIAGNILMLLLMLTSGVFDVPSVPYLHYSPSWQASEFLHGVWEGRPLDELIVPLCVLVGMSVVCGFIGAKMFRWRN